MGMDGRGERQYTERITLFGKEILATVTDTGKGMDVLIRGGDEGHIGAVAVGAPGEEPQVIAFPGPTEDAVCEPWAREIGKRYPFPVIVSAGIHYDGIDREQIGEVLRSLDGMLEKISSKLTRIEICGDIIKK